MAIKRVSSESESDTIDNMTFVPWSHFLNSHTNALVQFVDVGKLMSSSQVTKRCQELTSHKNNRKIHIHQIIHTQ